MKKNELRARLNTFALTLDCQWRMIKVEADPDAPGTPSLIAYNCMIHTFETLGGDWRRDETGHHTIFFDGVRGEAE